LEDIRYILEKTNSLVVVDEAYIDFSTKPSATTMLSEFPQLIVSQTFSKAYGLAGLRLGKAFMNPEIVAFLNKIKPPYNINSATQQIALDALENVDNVKKQVRELIAERERISSLLETFSTVQEVFPSEANFILFRVENADAVYETLKENGVIVRNRSTQVLCENTLRVSIGTVEENNRFIKLMCRKN
jgi:histidinol-phosphate aminotransferase